MQFVKSNRDEIYTVNGRVLMNVDKRGTLGPLKVAAQLDRAKAPYGTIAFIKKSKMRSKSSTKQSSVGLLDAEDATLRAPNATG